MCDIIGRKIAMKKKQQGYILRYYLPVKPNFDEEYTNKRFNELLDFCKSAKIDAVMFFVALHPDCYYMPETPDYAKEWRDQMLPYIKRLKDAGISYQLNFQNLLGANTHGDDFSECYNWEKLVDHKGRESKGCACPLGKKFREQTEKRLRIWAETEPDVIWLDDDFRMHNHGTFNEAVADGEAWYLDFYCFCDEHMRLFNERNNTIFTRETLVNEILKPGKPTQTRKDFLDFLSETMTETAQWIERVIHCVSPDTRIALMTSLTDIHAAEGRKWRPFLTGLCGKYAPILRPTFGPYRELEHTPRNFVGSYQQLSHLMTQLDEAGLSEVEFCPEVENTQFTVWAKSVAATTYQLELSAFMGCNDITLSLYDLDGGAFFEEPAYEKMLRDKKEYLDTLLALDMKNAKEIGVSIPTSSDSGRDYIVSKGDDYTCIGGKNRSIETYFLQMGIPCKFVSSTELENAEVVALDSYSASFLSDEVLKKVLSGKVFIDGEAAEMLYRRGFSEYIGIKSISGKQKIQVQSEVFINEKRSDGTYIRLPSRVPINYWYDVEVSEKAEVISQFMIPTGGAFTGLTYFENACGGNVVMFPAFRSWGSGFFNHTRVAIFKNIFKRLWNDMPIIECESFTQAVVRENENGKRYYFLTNLASDRAKQFKINGNTIETNLEVYQSVVCSEFDGKIEIIGKTKDC